MPHNSVTRTLFDVEYRDPDVEESVVYRVRVTMADRLNTEMRGRKYGLLDHAAQPNLVAYLWLWFASLREGHIDESTTFEEFQARIVDNGKVDEEEVPPTQEGASDDSLSPSPSDGPGSTGTPPSSTTRP